MPTILLTNQPSTSFSNNNNTTTNSFSQTQQTPLFIFDSIKRNDFEQVKLFIQQNPSLLTCVDDSDQLNTPLHVSCQCNHEQIALFLLDRIQSMMPTLGYLLTQENGSKQSAIMLASPRLRGMMKASMEIFKMKKLLLEKYKSKTHSTLSQNNSNELNFSSSATTSSVDSIENVRKETQKLYEMMQ
ncbi:hypothetical protein FDP41_004163 [Naegleria fowleri]|uniref:Ankyrin repeat-containing protein n=1 Tax=Naegleria fowleri TaxID=5763 RepID=A0A6A5BRY7_NAEFO|nr:uncharacterized protein FDP41_004163 [Naegleria fowleri]KAF0976868.1 hypothetical protein FDP41_004163 [Naegleria fowleri]CAG4716003.1 unnamed protein product [Naegleria fowleri]